MKGKVKEREKRNKKEDKVRDAQTKGERGRKRKVKEREET